MLFWGVAGIGGLGKEYSANGRGRTLTLRQANMNCLNCYQFMEETIIFRQIPTTSNCVLTYQKCPKLDIYYLWPKRP